MKKTAQLYIIHGWTYDVAPWQDVITSLKQQNITAQLLHVPGLTAASGKSWTIAQYADWADQNLPDGTIALGHSNGGRILMNLLVKHPNKLKGLILLDSAGIPAQPTLRRRILRIVAKLFAPLKPIKPLRKFFHRFIGANDYSQASDHMKQTLQNMIDSDKQLNPSLITTPTQIIWGAKDTSTPLSEGKALHRKIKNSKLIIEPEWGHSPYLKAPKALAKVIAKSYRELSA